MMYSIRFMTFLALFTAMMAVPSLSFADEWIQFDSVQFSIEGDRPLDALERALEDLPRLTSTYRPEGADISDREITSRGPRGVPRIVFRATHRVGIISKSAVVRADIETREDTRACTQKASDAQAYRIHVSTDASEHLVAANVDTFVVSLCVNETNGGSEIDVVARGSMKKGYSYGRFAGPAVRDLIKAQTDPLLEALMEVVDYYQGR